MNPFIDKATFWRMNDRDIEGKATFNSPIKIMVRWEQKQEVFQDKNGDEVLSKAIVYFDGMIRNSEGSLFYPSVEDVVIMGEHPTPMMPPKPPEGSFRIRAMSIVRSLSGDKVMVKAWL